MLNECVFYALASIRRRRHQWRGWFENYSRCHKLREREQEKKEHNVWNNKTFRRTLSGRFCLQAHCARVLYLSVTVQCLYVYVFIYILGYVWSDKRQSLREKEKSIEWKRCARRTLPERWRHSLHNKEHFPHSRVLHMFFFANMRVQEICRPMHLVWQQQQLQNRS